MSSSSTTTGGKVVGGVGGWQVCLDGFSQVRKTRPGRRPRWATYGLAWPVCGEMVGVRWSLRTLEAGALADCCLRCRLMVVVLGWWPVGAAGPASGGGRECWPAGGLGRADAETESCEAAGGLVR